MKRLLTLIYLIILALTIKAQEKNTSYSGSIKGYNISWGFKTGKLIVDDVITGLSEMYLIDITPEGKYTIAFPLRSNKECWISFPFFNSAVYFQSGKKLVQDFDATDANKVASVFKGDGAIINNDINKIRPVLSDYNWDSIYSDIYQLSPEQYKTYFLNMQARKLAAVDSVAKNSGLNKTSLKLAHQNIRYTIADFLIYYNSKREDAYRKKNKIPFIDRKPVLKVVKLEPGYYDFLRTLSYNDPSAMESSNYHIFINRIKFLDLIYDKAGRTDYTKEISALKQHDTTNSGIKATIKLYEKLMTQNATNPGAIEKVRPVVLKSLIKADITLELELMRLQDTCQIIEQKKIPLSNTALASLKAGLKNPYLFPAVLELNNKVKQEIEASKKQTRYSNNITPQVAADSVFSHIISKYRGKIVLIDFWATWCVPCLQGIQEIAPLKEELKDENIVFLYITNNSSPQNTYNILIPGIKGEHYKVTADEFNVLSNIFGINGIPHYAIANKNGFVVEKHFHWGNTEELKNKLVSIMKE